jgi:hypothetical protein
MATEKDRNFVDFLLEQTRAGNVKWEATATSNEFAAGVRGKYKAVVDQQDISEGFNTNIVERLVLRDVDDRILIEVTNREWGSVRDLYELARRNALNVDAALDEIMGGAGNDDLPF